MAFRVERFFVGELLLELGLELGRDDGVELVMGGGTTFDSGSFPLLPNGPAMSYRYRWCESGLEGGADKSYTMSIDEGRTLFEVGLIGLVAYRTGQTVGG